MDIKVVSLFFAANLLVSSQFLCMNNNNNEPEDIGSIAAQLIPECEEIIKRHPELKVVIKGFIDKMHPTCLQNSQGTLCSDCKKYAQNISEQLSRIATTYHQRVLTTRIHIISFVVFVVLAVCIPLYPELQLAGNGGLIVLIAGAVLCHLAASRQVVSIPQLISILVAYIIYARIFYLRSDEYAASQAGFEEFYRCCCQGHHLGLD
jgi:hypothetical protein